jgi:uncharacterized protein (TIGR04255 family)
MNLFSDKPRKIYKHNPIKEVVCQLRFPINLSIGAEEPTDFQKLVRKDFPEYDLINEPMFKIQLPPLSNIKEQDIKASQTIAKNYCFKSIDKDTNKVISKINLVNNFIAFTTTAYRTWDEFWGIYEDILNKFFRIKDYKPSFFDRVGLRYIDAINREELGLKDKRWIDLIKPMFLGIMNASDISEDMLTSNSYNAHLKLGEEKSYLKFHAGIAKLEDSPNIQFVIDSDFYSTEILDATDINKVKEKFEYLHGYSGKLFRSIITQTLEKKLGEIKND